MDGGAGAYYSDGRFSAGASISQLIQSKLNLATVINATERAKLYSQYFFTSSYVIPTGDGTKLIPNVLSIVIPHAPTEFEFGCKVDYQEKIWWALNWRVNQFWSIQTGFKLFKKLSLAYCYDYYNSPFSDFNTGNNAHEIGLRFELPKKAKSGK
jgi:type IX secretion system PorP/SprF family membrane protein